MNIKIFNATEQEIKGKFNIFIGVSLGVLKPLTEDIAKEYISWALKNCKEEAVILIADEIAKYNYQIFSKYSTGKAQRRAEREGDIHVDFFKKIIDENFQNKKIKIIKWKDIWTENKQRMKKILEEEYNSNNEFRNRVKFFLNKYAEKRNKELTEEQISILTHYVLAEMTTLLEGISYGGTEYRLLLYPTSEESGMSDMIAKIQNGELFPRLKEKLDLKTKTVMVETYISIAPE